MDILLVLEINSNVLDSSDRVDTLIIADANTAEESRNRRADVIDPVTFCEACIVASGLLLAGWPEYINNNNNNNHLF